MFIKCNRKKLYVKPVQWLFGVWLVREGLTWKGSRDISYNESGWAILSMLTGINQSPGNADCRLHSSMVSWVNPGPKRGTIVIQVRICNKCCLSNAGECYAVSEARDNWTATALCEWSRCNTVSVGHKYEYVINGSRTPVKKGYLSNWQ